MSDMHQTIYVAGHRGMVGAALLRELGRRGHEQVITRTHAELDLTEQAQVREFFQTQRPARVYLAAAKVGGIHANDSYPAEFIHRNLMIAANVIHEAWRAGVQRLLFLGSSCIYPRLAPQPIPEEALLTGVLESTNEPYAIAKIAGIKLCESYNRQYGTDYRSVMPPTSTAPATITTPKTATSYPPCCAAPMRPRSAVAPNSSSGAPAPHGANSSMSMTWPPPACTSWT